MWSRIYSRWFVCSAKGASGRKLEVKCVNVSSKSRRRDIKLKGKNEIMTLCMCVCVREKQSERYWPRSDFDLHRLPVRKQLTVCPVGMRAVLRQRAACLVHRNCYRARLLLSQQQPLVDEFRHSFIKNYDYIVSWLHLEVWKSTLWWGIDESVVCFITISDITHEAIMHIRISWRYWLYMSWKYTGTYMDTFWLQLEKQSLHTVSSTSFAIKVIKAEQGRTISTGNPNSY